MTASECSAYDQFQEGTRCLAAGDARAAVGLLERARDLEPAKSSIREALARAYFSSGKVVAARFEFARAVELDPVNDYAHFGLGVCLLRSGDHSGARRHLKLAMAMRPLDEYRRALERAVER